MTSINRLSEQPVSPEQRDRIDPLLSAMAQCLGGMPHPALITDPNFHLQYANPAAIDAFFQRDNLDLTQGSLLELFPEQAKTITEAITTNPSQVDESIVVHQMPYLLPDGQTEWLNITIKPSFDKQYWFIYPTLTTREVELTQYAETDTLTGLKNRNYFNKRGKELDDENTEYGIVLCDVDGLKGINDTFGHPVGDQLIISAAEFLKKIFPKADLARIGGDEFAALVVNQNQNTKLPDLKGRVIEALQNQTDKNPVHMSVGVAYRQINGHNFKTIYKEADDELYKNRDNGKFGMLKTILLV